MKKKKLKNKPDIQFYHMGNGISVCDRNNNDPRTNDYPFVAHISVDRVVELKQWELSETDIKKINQYAKTADPCVSATQETKVFKTRPEIIMTDANKLHLELKIAEMMTGKEFKTLLETDEQIANWFENGQITQDDFVRFSNELDDLLFRNIMPYFDNLTMDDNSKMTAQLLRKLQEKKITEIEKTPANLDILLELDGAINYLQTGVFDIINEPINDLVNAIQNDFYKTCKKFGIHE